MKLALVMATALVGLLTWVVPAEAQFCCRFRIQDADGQRIQCHDDLGGLNEFGGVQWCASFGGSPGVGSCDDRCFDLPVCCENYRGLKNMCVTLTAAECHINGGRVGFNCQQDGNCEILLE